MSLTLHGKTDWGNLRYSFSLPNFFFDIEPLSKKLTTKFCRFQKWSVVVVDIRKSLSWTKNQLAKFLLFYGWQVRVQEKDIQNHENTCLIWILVVWRQMFPRATLAFLTLGYSALINKKNIMQRQKNESRHFQGLFVVSEK